jgi:hypothetical protein
VAYETAYRCLAYTYAILPILTLLGFVPYLNLVGLAWMLYLLIVASVEVHNIAAKIAWIVFGILTALLALFQISAYQAARQMDQSDEAMQRNMGQFSKQMEQMQKQIF